MTCPRVFFLYLSTSLLVNYGAAVDTGVIPADISEGGALNPTLPPKTTKHEEREGSHFHQAIKSVDSVPSHMLSSAVQVGSTKTPILNLTQIYVVPGKNDDKVSKAKKGDGSINPPVISILPPPASSSEINKTQSTTELPPAKKPTITETSDEDTNNDKASPVTDKKPDNKPADKPLTIEAVTERKEDKKRANFVIPIVAVILSVPVVAIVLSFLYKRGTDWWQHRNYKRMDFLVEGMYNN